MAVETEPVEQEKPPVVKPEEDYSTFLPDRLPHQQQEKKPEPKPEAQPPASVAKPAQPPPAPVSSPPAEKLPAELVDMAEAFGFSKDEIAQFGGDAKALTKTISHLVRSQPVPDERETPRVPAEEPFSADAYTSENYDEGIVKLAKQVAKLTPLADKLAALEKLELDKHFPQILQHVAQTANERGKQQFQAAIKEAGFDPEILNDKTSEAKVLSLVRGLASAYDEAGEARPPLATIMKSILPLVGAAAPPSQPGGQPPAGPKSDKTEQQRAEQAAALERQRNPLNGQFVATPSHRGSGKFGSGDPLRDYMLDNNIEPGPPPAKEDYTGFLPNSRQ
jgi:hypothetical protein